MLGTGKPCHLPRNSFYTAAGWLHVRLESCDSNVAAARGTAAFAAVRVSDPAVDAFLCRRYILAGVCLMPRSTAELTVILTGPGERLNVRNLVRCIGLRSVQVRRTMVTEHVRF
jgi:hypothetical protein